MTTETHAAAAAPEEMPVMRDSARRPRVGLMGEFSAGKSTLTNLLIGAPALPVKVTATQLPPVWLSHGSDAPCRVALDGTEHPLDLSSLDTVPVEETLYLRVFREADILEMCDLIDFPGISDPNMPPDVWERVAPMVDSVLWLTHATQAWRQSEAAVWATLPEALHATSLLLLTRWDKLLTERDRNRVLARVRHETAGQFSGLHPVSLIQATAAVDDHAAWQASGAEAFTSALVTVLGTLSKDLGHEGAQPAFGPSAPIAVEPTEAPIPLHPAPDGPDPKVRPRRVVLRDGGGRGRRLRPV